MQSSQHWRLSTAEVWASTHRTPHADGSAQEKWHLRLEASLYQAAAQIKISHRQKAAAYTSARARPRLFQNVLHFEWRSRFVGWMKPNAVPRRREVDGNHSPVELLSAGSLRCQDDSPLIHLASGSWVWNSALNRSSTVSLVSLPGWLSTAGANTERNKQAVNRRAGFHPNLTVSRWQSHAGPSSPSGQWKLLFCLYLFYGILGHTSSVRIRHTELDNYRAEG